MSKYVHLFAARTDLLPVLDAVEHKRRLKYVVRKTSNSPDLVTIRRGVDLPNLGAATSPDAVGCQTFFVADEGSQLQPRRTVSHDGSLWWHLDQLHNPDTVEL